MEKGERPEEAERREVREETGYEVDALERVGSSYSAPGYLTQKTHVFIADLSTCKGSTLEEHQFDIQTVRCDSEKVDELLLQGDTPPSFFC